MILTTTHGPANALVLVSGEPQSARVATDFPGPLVVLVTDAWGNPVPNIYVDLNDPNPLHGWHDWSNSQGIASTTWPAGTVAGPLSVAAGIPLNNAQANVVFHLTVEPGPPSSVVVFSGAGQSAVVDSVFSAPLIAMARDAYLNGVPGVPVNWTAPGNGATATVDALSSTDAAGHASTTARAGTISGNYSIDASINGGAARASFAMTNVSGPAVSLAVSGAPSGVVAGTPFAVVLAARDSHGNVATGYRGTVHFTSNDAIAALPADYTFAAGDAGARTFALTLKTAGTRTVTVTDTGVPSLSVGQTASVVHAGPRYDLSIVQGVGTHGTVGTMFPNPFVAWLRDVYGNPVEGMITWWCGLWTSGCTTATTNGDGLASLQPVATTVAGDTHGHVWTNGYLPSETSFPLTLDPGPPDRLTVVSGDPQSTVIETVFAGSLVVLVQDMFGNAVPSAQVGFLVQDAEDRRAVLSTGAPGVPLSTYVEATSDGSGRASVQATAGSRAEGYAVTAMVGAHTASFRLTNMAGSPTVVEAGAGTTPQSATVGTAFTTALRAVVRDARGNPVPAVQVTWSAPQAGATAALADSFSITDSSGEATTTATAGTVAGAFSVNASINNGAAAVVFALANTAGLAASFEASGIPDVVTAGVARNAMLAVHDLHGNLATSYTGIVALTSSDAVADLAPATIEFVAGEGGEHPFIVTFKTASPGLASVTASASDTPTLRGTRAGITVQPGAARAFRVEGFASIVLAETPTSLRVVALDEWGNVASGYSGTVRFSSSDARASVPADSTLVSGAGTFTVVPQVAGSASLQIADRDADNPRHSVFYTAVAPLCACFGESPCYVHPVTGARLCVGLPDCRLTADHEWRCYCTGGSGFDDHDPCTADWCDGIVGQPHHDPVVGCPPEDPAATAPPANRAQATSVAATASLLYSGPSAVQTGVDESAISSARAAILRGKMRQRGEQAGLSGVLVSVLDHLEFGYTITRADGMYDLAVNGGGQLVVQFWKDGYLPAQRAVDVPWQQFVLVPEVALVLLVPDESTTILVGSPTVQWARGAVEDDEDGERQATIIVPSGEAAWIELADGTSEPVATSLTVRATEFTVGRDGLAAMPASLPPSSAYTYAIDLSADEAADAVGVAFEPPLSVYVENFLGFPAGTHVPVGFHDVTRGVWVPQPDGRVIRILGVDGDLAQLDVDGSSTPASADELEELGITSEERTVLTGRYWFGTPGVTLWRVPIRHFSTYDFNWPIRPQGYTDQPPPNVAKATLPPPNDGPCAQGSVIDCYNQALGESLPIIGMGDRLYYTSRHVLGRHIEVPASKGTVSPQLRDIIVRLSVAGQLLETRLGTGTSQTATFDWDGRNAYGQIVQGSQAAQVLVGYVYPNSRYGVPAASADSFGLPASGSFPAEAPAPQRTTTEVVLWQSYPVTLGGWSDRRSLGLGGWVPGALQAYDPVARSLVGASGSVRGGETASGLHIAAGTGTWSSLANVGDGGPATAAQVVASDVALAGDGSYYIADGMCRVRRVDANGTITRVAGRSNECDDPHGPVTDGILATDTPMVPAGVAIGIDGSIYIADDLTGRIRRVTADGVIRTVAGGGNRLGSDANGFPALEAAFQEVRRVAASADGALYVASKGGAFRIAPDGTIATVEQQWVDALALEPDGSVLLGAWVGMTWKVVRVRPDGTKQVVAGGDTPGYLGDGGPAIEAGFGRITGLASDRAGGFYVADFGKNCVRQVDSSGVIKTAAGRCGSWGPPTEGMPATGGPLREQGVAFSSVAVAPDGALYLGAGLRVLRVAPSMPAVGTEDVHVPSADGREVYVFNASGLHRETRDVYTGTRLLTFGYDADGRLDSITDLDGRVARFEHVGTDETHVVAPFGQTTILRLDSNGWLSSVTNPAGETVTVRHDERGLLRSLQDAKNHPPKQFQYNDTGTLREDTDAAGGTKQLSRFNMTDGFDIQVTTRLTTTQTRTVVHSLRTDFQGNQTRTEAFPERTNQSVTHRDAAGNEWTIAPDGTSDAGSDFPDPLWGMQAPYRSVNSTTTPDEHLTRTVTRRRSVLLGAPGDPTPIDSQTDEITVNSHDPTLVAWDRATNKRTIRSPMGRISTATYDARGRITNLELPWALPISYTYYADDEPSHGKLKQVSQGDRTTGFDYDSLGRLQRVRDPYWTDQSPEEHRVMFDYDGADRLSGETQPDGSTLVITYDANGNVHTVQPPNRPKHVFEYTAVDGVSDYSPPPPLAGDTGLWNTKHFYSRMDHQLTLMLLPGGRAIDPEYDGFGRLWKTAIFGGAYERHYDDSAAKLDWVSSPDGVTETFAYDGPLFKGTAWSGAVSSSVTRTYDDDFLQRTISVAGSDPVAQSFDADGLLTQVGALGLERYPLGDSRAGLLKRTTVAGAAGTLAEDFDYNEFGELKSQAAALGTRLLYSAQCEGADFRRDKLGRIVRKVETIDGQVDTYEYGYDANGRLETVTLNGLLASRHGYDANGNRLWRTVDNDSRTDVGVPDDQDRLKSYGHFAYGYRANGELDSKTDSTGDVTKYRYDALGNLRRVDLPDQTVVEYLVDGESRRVVKKVDGVAVQKFIWEDRLRIAAELDASDNVVSRFVYGTRVNVPDYMVRGGVTYRIVTDHLGSVRLVVNPSTGTVVQRMKYDEWGNVLVDEHPGFDPVPFGFAGGLYDRDTGLVRFGARDYDSYTGTWTAKDPIGFRGGLLLFGYANGDPVNYMDPTGYCTVPPGMVVPPGVNINANMESAMGKDYRWFANKVKAFGSWDYSGNLHPKYNRFTQFNYGATGTAAGFSDWVLLRAAGLFQWVFGDNRDSVGSPFGGPPYGDDPADQPWIQAGIQYGRCFEEEGVCE